MFINVDKLITVNYCSPCCDSFSSIKAFKKNNRFPDYVQCHNCNSYMAIHSEPPSSNVKIRLLNKEEEDWIDNTIMRSASTNTPLLIWKTKCKITN